MYTPLGKVTQKGGATTMRDKENQVDLPTLDPSTIGAQTIGSLRVELRAYDISSGGNKVNMVHRVTRGCVGRYTT